ncbi:transposase [Clostridium tyrobutyricum]|uniref:transposase n=1 Tax=Clostridium tyrobutyricum TaxID=1519 RepID=UPI003BFA015B
MFDNSSLYKLELLKEWLKKAKSTGIEEIISFTNRIECDYETVMNVVYLPYSNRLAEEYINKINVIKKVMYGRYSFETLINKTI